MKTPRWLTVTIKFLFPDPPPPLVLSGAWTAEERRDVVAMMYDSLMHMVQGRAEMVPTVEWNYFGAYSEIVRTAPPEVIEQNWLEMTARYFVITARTRRPPTQFGRPPTEYEEAVCYGASRRPANSGE